MSYDPTRPFPAQPPPGYGPPPLGQAPAQPPKKSNVPLIVGIVCATVLLLCGGLVALAAVAPETPAPAATPAAPATKQAVQPAAVAPTAATPPAGTAPTLPPKVSPPALPPVQAAPQVAMPNVVGQNAAIAGDHLEKLGFTNIEYGSQDEFDTWVALRSNWTVTKQSHKAGRKVAVDALIVLTCTKSR